jgi:DNA-binding NarL/FixJ family response regulator
MRTGPHVLLVEDHPLYRDGLAQVLAAHVPGVRCDVADGAAAGLARLQAADLDLVVADWHLPDGDGLALLEQVGALRPTVARVLLSGDEDPHLAARAQRLGLMGFVPKRLTPAQVGAALTQVLGGEPWFPPATAKHAAPAAPDALTPRQRHVLAQAAAGAGNKQIARSLGVSERTIKFHLAQAYERLQVSTRTEAVACALARGLIRPTRD